MKQSTNSIRAYFDLVKARPNLFVQSEHIPLVLDERKMIEFSQEGSIPMGVVFDNTPYYYVIADLCATKSGKLYRYSRVVYDNENSNGVVAIPYYNGYFGLVSIFRHGPRTETGGEFPRGFSETKGLTIEEHLYRELSEELGVNKDTECEVTFLGDARADSGLSSGKAQVYLVAFSSADNIVPTNREGVHGFEWVTEKELRTRIKNNLITDGFTLSAYAKYITSM